MIMISHPQEHQVHLQRFYSSVSVRRDVVQVSLDLFARLHGRPRRASAGGSGGPARTAATAARRRPPRLLTTSLMGV